LLEEDMADEDKLVKAGFEVVFKPVADLIERLAGPAAEEFGLTIQDHVRVFRLKRQLRLFQRTKEMLEKAGVEPKRVPLKFLGPVVESASFEEDNELQDRWAALLANAAATPTDIHPAYIEILKQLSSTEVLLLEILHKKGSPKSGTYDFYKELAARLDVEHLSSDVQSPVPTVAEEVDNRLDRLGVVGNLTRLGCISVEGIRHGPTYYSLTTFGKNFCRACSPPQASQKNAKRSSSE
jgi:hypothetical protein